MAKTYDRVEAIALLLAYVAYADELIDRAEREAIGDSVAALVPTEPAGTVIRKVEAVLAGGKLPVKVGRACLALSAEPPELKRATLRAAWLVARSHEKASPNERARVHQLARDLGIGEEELERLTGP